MHKKKKGKKGFLLFKIDFEKAYDMVDWNFLNTTLNEFGFPSQTVELIMNCTTSTSLSLKWNGEKLNSFQPNRGLRQGDPMSPYLFVLCMEKLALLIQEKVHDRKWNPIRIDRNGPAISHLFFADDCLLFTQAKSSQVRLVQEVLHTFCLASGLKINVQKSSFIASRNVPRSNISQFASIVGYQHTQKLGKYLGFPMLSGRVTKSDFAYILDKVDSRLAGWKSKLLNRAGKITLAKSVVSAIPVYTMQNYWLPTSICDSIDTKVRGFIWGGRSSHWVNWPTITQPRGKGGLGIHRARETNIALLGKHVWSLLHDQDKLWVHLLSSKYLKNNHTLHMEVSSGTSYTWSSIVKAANWLSDGFVLRLGKGEVSFWYDKWLESGPLCHEVPFVFIHDTQLMVCDIFYDGYWHWQNCATSIDSHIKHRIMCKFLDGVSEDAFIWGRAPAGNYTVKAGYNWLLSHGGDQSNDHSQLVLGVETTSARKYQAVHLDYPTWEASYQPITPLSTSFRRSVVCEMWSNFRVYFTCSSGLL